jgi:exosortase A-associated hydrolase 2
VVAQQARALAQAGYGVLQIDLLGCGDSSGEFADATWAAWLHDAQQARHWLLEQGGGPLWLWGMRAGALLAAQLAQQPQEGGDPTHLLLWQPVASGQQQLQQFLRLQAASQWLGNASSGQTPAQALALGESVHIAGYTLSANLARGLGDARLTPPRQGQPGRLVWLESRTSPRNPRQRQAACRLERRRLARTGSGRQRPGVLANRGHRRCPGPDSRHAGSTDRHTATMNVQEQPCRLRATASTCWAS